MPLSTKLRALGLALRGDSEKRHRIAEWVALKLHPEGVIGDVNKVWLADVEFRELYLRFSPHLRRLERVWMVDQLAAAAAVLPGDFVECGTYTGMTAFMLCRRASPASKAVHLFDSWEGLSAPNSLDGSYWHQGDLQAAEQQARANLSEFSCARFYRGWIPTRFDEVSDLRFAFLHIDVDIYEPTLAALEFFWQRLVPGGIVVCDDYGFSNNPGAFAAVNEFFDAKRERVIHLTTGQSLTVKLPLG